MAWMRFKDLLDCRRSFCISADSAACAAFLFVELTRWPVPELSSASLFPSESAPAARFPPGLYLRPVRSSSTSMDLNLISGELLMWSKSLGSS